MPSWRSAASCCTRQRCAAVCAGRARGVCAHTQVLTRAWRCLLLQVAIEQLQSELTASRKEEAVIREEAQRVRGAVDTQHRWQPALPKTRSTCTPLHAPTSQICDDQAAELRRAEEQLAAVQSALAARTSQVRVCRVHCVQLPHTSSPLQPFTPSLPPPPVPPPPPPPNAAACACAHTGDVAGCALG
jgi:hypothetical protein